MSTFSTRLGRVPVLIAAGAIALVLFGLLLLASRPSTPPPVAQISPSAPPVTVAPSGATLSAAQPAPANSAARSEPTNTPPAPKASPMPSETSAVAAAPSGGSDDTASVGQAADGPQTEAGLSTIADGAQPRAASSTTTVPAQAAQADQAAATQRYIDIAQRVAPPRKGDRPGSVWNARVIEDDQGHAVMLIMPLDAGANNAEFVRAAKERIAAIVNAMFLNDPQVIRVGVIGTFPNQSGTEVPAVSMIVNKAASPRWGQVSPTELERIAQSLAIEQQFLR